MDMITNFLIPFSLPVFVAVAVIQWVFWIFKLGRFKTSNNNSSQETHLRYIFANFVVNIINDFRHLLALIIVFIFATALFVTLYKTGQKIDDISTAMQSVSSTFGGLIGAIIGFYFGEKTASLKHEAKKKSSPIDMEIEEQDEPIDISGIEEISEPDDGSKS